MKAVSTRKPEERMKISTSFALALTVIALLSGTVTASADPQVASNCMTCHLIESPGIYNQWFQSRHAMSDITCIDCHQAQEGEPDGYMHEGAFISTLVTPLDCGQCHDDEAQQVGNSYHAHAGEILDSEDAYLAHVTAGEPAAMTGCESCHGCKVQIDPASSNMLSKKSWPNSGIGRLNPDGSKGSCNACHTRHSFDKAQARQPEACSKCHLGPDHPQKEVYEESKHGNAYYTHINKMNLDSDKWVVGVDYYEAPTCATCHMSATTTMAVTHDVGDRISWTLRPPISKKKDSWESKRANMKAVCASCHSSTFADGHYYQFDASVNLYNEKFARPATEIMRLVKENKLLEYPASFGNKIEWTYWELWHHEGRRFRHGASMMGPDYSWWHGAYEVAQHFYFKLIPEARKFKNAEVDAYIDNLIKNDPMHTWLTKSTDELKRGIRSGELQEVYKDFFESK
jgi:hydroxylamine dehydrogenase